MKVCRNLFREIGENENKIANENWTASGDGTLSIEDKLIKSVKFEYYNDDSLYGSNYEFSAIAKETTVYELTWHYEWHHCWYNASAKAEIFVEGPNAMTEVVVDRSSDGWEEETGTIVLEVTEGKRFGVRIEACHNDRSRVKRGTFILSQ